MASSGKGAASKAAGSSQRANGPYRPGRGAASDCAAGTSWVPGSPMPGTLSIIWGHEGAFGGHQPSGDTKAPSAAIMSRVDGSARGTSRRAAQGAQLGD